MQVYSGCKKKQNNTTCEAHTPDQTGYKPPLFKPKFGFTRAAWRTFTLHVGITCPARRGFVCHIKNLTINDTAKHLVCILSWNNISCQVAVRLNWANVFGQALLLQTRAGLWYMLLTHRRHLCWFMLTPKIHKEEMKIIREKWLRFKIYRILA